MESVVYQDLPDRRESQDYKDYLDCLVTKANGATRDLTDQKEIVDQMG